MTNAQKKEALRILRLARRNGLWACTCKTKILSTCGYVDFHNPGKCLFQASFNLLKKLK